MTRRTSSSSGPVPLLQTPIPTPKRGRPGYVKGAWFDQAAVDRFVRFARLCHHTKGRWAGLPVELDPWQLEYLIAPVFGWKHPDGTRIIRTAWWELCRKNGKSTIGSVTGLYLTSADGEPGADVVSAAGAKEQARYVFDPARQMVLASPELKRRLQPFRTSIVFPKRGSSFKVVSARADLQHGANLHGAVIDEVHVHKTRDLIDAIETSTGSRDQPLIVFITTADEGEEHSIYDEKRTYAEGVASGTIEDPTFYACIFAAPENADPFAERTWELANPGIDVTVKREYLRKEARKAKVTPGYLATFRRLHTGVRARDSKKWLDLDRWDRQAGIVVREQLAGATCYGGLDLSSSLDITAFELVFPRDPEREDEQPRLEVLSSFFMPEEQITRQTQASQVPYTRWRKEGLITATEGEIVDYRVVKERILEASRAYDLRAVGYDPANATQLVLELIDEGVDMVPVRQGFLSLSPPSKELERLVIAGRLRHGGNAVLRWMADVVEVKVDPADNIKPVKPDRRKSVKRIDGIVALVMAIDQWTREDTGRSAYEDHGLLFA